MCVSLGRVKGVLRLLIAKCRQEVNEAQEIHLN